jgi:hypothetical protein
MATGIWLSPGTATAECPCNSTSPVAMQAIKHEARSTIVVSGPGQGKTEALVTEVTIICLVAVALPPPPPTNRGGASRNLATARLAVDVSRIWLGSQHS